MPELPDVEATLQYLRPFVVGRTFEEAQMGWPQAVQKPSLARFQVGLRGQTVRGLERRAKYLLFLLSRGQTLVIHLGMTGALVVTPDTEPRHRFAHNMFLLDNHNNLQVVDPRKLGKIWVVTDAQGILEGLGPEPLDNSLTSEGLAQRLNSTGALIKAVLCDQRVVAGLGNIYADEVLFAAGVHPLRRGKELSRQEVGKILEAMRRVLPRATSALVELLPLTEPPSESTAGAPVLRVSRRPGAPCSNCGGPVQRIEVRGRGTYLCPGCQQ